MEDDAPLLENGDGLLRDDNENDDLAQLGVTRGHVKYELKANYESLDYEIVQSTVRLVDQKRLYRKSSRRIEVERWFCCFLIGLFTGLTGILITVAIDLLAEVKRNILNFLFDPAEGIGRAHSVLPVLTWTGINFVLVFVAGVLCAFFAPVAAGSGIPQIKCFLNGVKVPKVIRLRTYAVKTVGIILAVVGGLACGKEGPMVHAGAVIAAGISQGQSISLKFSTSIFEEFRDDHEKRDFVAAGAAAGVSAAFGAPVGGVLFALEEAASFWNQLLTWRIFFCSMTSFMTLNYGLSALKPDQQFGNLTSPGLLNFGKFSDSSWFWYEIPIFMIMGCVGGLLGAGFVALNKRITIERIRLKPGRFVKSLEAGLIALLSGCLMILLLYFNPFCRDEKSGDTDSSVDLSEFNKLRMNCGPHEYNTMSLLSFGTPEIAVKAMFHKGADYFHLQTLLMFFPTYWFLSCITYGISVPSGLFVPALLCGATWGRILFLLLAKLFGNDNVSDPNVYALVGAAAGLGGTVRMTLSLCVIILEATGNLTLVLPVTVVLIIAKIVGDAFTEGIYDTHIHLLGVPLLEWEPPRRAELVEAKHVMSSPVVKLASVAKVSDVFNVLASDQHQHNGFPVVDPITGKYLGMTLRSHILLLLRHKKFFNSQGAFPPSLLSQSQIRSSYPRFFPIHDLKLTSDDHDLCIDLRPYLNQSANILTEGASLASIFRLFRALGLRHVTIVDSNMIPVGIVTRKDISRFRSVSGTMSRLPVQTFDNSSVHYD